MNQGNHNRLHELPLERMENTLANPGCVVFTFLGIFLIISCGGIIIFWLAYRHGLNMGLAALRVLQPPREEPLPTLFIINNTYFIPNHEYNPETAFTFGSTYLLESYYRFNGIDNRYLSSNQYLRLNQNLLSQTLIEQCQKEELKSTHFCLNEGRPDDLLTFSSFFNDNVVFPIEFNSTFSEADKSENPLKFSVSEIQIFSGISATKRSLLILNQPLIMTIPMPMARFWYPCSDDINNEMCQQKLFRCDYNFSEHCYYSDIPITGDYINFDSNQIVAGISQSLVLVGYNDYFISNDQNFNLNSQLGGFILKNGHGDVGHSINYLVGSITNQEENRICPDPKNAFYWIPATLECAKSNKENISNCNRNAHVISGQKILFGSTELRCINEKYCEKEEKYVLLAPEDSPMSQSFGVLPTGTKYAKVIKISSGEVVEIKNLPFIFINLAFLPTIYGNANNELCGYLMYSYESINKLSARVSKTTENWRVVNAKVKWQKRSYPSTYDKFNYTYVQNSLRNISDFYLKDTSIYFEL